MTASGLKHIESVFDDRSSDGRLEFAGELYEHILTLLEGKAKHRGSAEPLSLGERTTAVQKQVLELPELLDALDVWELHQLAKGDRKRLGPTDDEMDIAADRLLQESIRHLDLIPYDELRELTRGSSRLPHVVVTVAVLLVLTLLLFAMLISLITRAF